MDDATFLQRFEASQISMEEWHHREHIKAAYLYLCIYPFDEAIARLRDRIQALNVVHRVPDLPHRGYHETLTMAWMRLVEFALAEHGPAATSDEFLAQHPSLGDKQNLLLFYSRDILSLPRAKAEFAEPDLAPFPRSGLEIAPEKT